MANAKKTTAKKTTAKKTTKRPTARKTTAAKKNSKSVFHGSFVVSAEKTPFMSFRFTDQTVYWAIFSVVVLALGLWVLQLHLAVEEIYNSIELNHAIYSSTDLAI